MGNRITHFVVKHREDDDTSQNFNLEINVKNSGLILQNPKLLWVFQTCVSALQDEGLCLTVTGEEDE